MVLLLATGLQTTDAQQNRNSVVRLFRLDGSFGTELPLKVISNDRPESVAFVLRDVRLEADSMGFLTRLRSVLTLANGNTSQRINEAEWRLDVYDEDLHSLSQRVVQKDKLNIYAGETAAASAKFGAVLPDRMVVLLQLIRVSFADGSAWLAPEECSLGADLRTVTFKSK